MCGCMFMRPLFGIFFFLNICAQFCYMDSTGLVADQSVTVRMNEKSCWKL